MQQKIKKTGNVSNMSLGLRTVVFGLRTSVFGLPASVFGLLTLILLLASCSSDSTEAKKEKLDKLRKEASALNKEIAELEAELGEEASNKGGKKIFVSTLDLEPRTFHHYIEIQGNANSKQNVLIYPEFNAQVKQILLNTGDRVSKGQVIAILDDEVIRKQIDELESSIDLARTLYQRQKNLWDQKIGSEVQYLQAKNNLESLENKLKTARSQQAKTRITSPINGVLDQVNLHVGELASPMQPAFRVVNLSTIEVTAEVSEAYSGQIKNGDNAEIIFPSLGMKKEAKIRYVGQVINPGDRTFRIEAEIDNSDGRIKPNSLANIRVADYRNENAFIIPTNAIQSSVRGDFVFIAEKKGDELVARRVFVTRGKSYLGETEILEGLTGDEKVIVAGFTNIIDGDEVIERI
jgi:membrane fusion protein, multidrug efflux system